jgi:tetratricopeptide (TPR) repeat protein
LGGDASAEERLQRAETLTGMADLLSRKGDYEAALPLILESLAIRRAVREPVHADIAENLEDLGLNYYDRGDYESAIEHLQAAVDMRRELNSGPFPATSEALSNLALVHLDAGNYEAAEELWTEALEMDRSYFGEKHPELSANINNLAFVYHDMGDLESAEKFYRQAIAMDEELLGPDHPEYAFALSNLAFLLLDLGRPDEAIAMQSTATKILDRAYGEAHPQLATALSGLGFMLNEEKSYAAAELHLVRALAMRRELLGPDNPEVGKSLLTIATLHLDTGKFELAEKEASQAYELFQDKIGEEHWLSGAALSVFGAALAEQEQYAEAEDTLIRAHATLIESGNAMPVFVEATVARITNLYQAIGQPDKANQYLIQNN